MNDSVGGRTSKNHNVVHSILINLGGQVAPMFVAIWTIPKLIEGLGTDRFGVLSLAWLVIGYFSIFDLGLGRALTQIVADRISRGLDQEVPELFWTAMTLMTVMGLVGAVLAMFCSEWLSTDILKIPEELQREAVLSFRLLAVSIPIVILTAGAVGQLTAYLRFDIINAVRVPLGISNYLLPLGILPYSKSLVWLTLVLIVTRFIAACIYMAACFKVDPRLLKIRRRTASAMYSLFRFGTWMTLSNIIGPIMVYMDRFLIGAGVSVAAVAYYTTPYETMTKLLIIPATIAGVIFPLLSASGVRDTMATARVLRGAMLAVGMILSVPTLLAFCFAAEILRFWLGEEFAQNGASVLRWLAAGTFINGLAQILFAGVQGLGRSSITAKLHMIELSFYLPALWIAVKKFGIVGVAVVWSARIALDAVLLALVMRSLIREEKLIARTHLIYAATAFVALFAVTTLESILLRQIFFGLGLILLAVVCLRHISSLRDVVMMRLSSGNDQGPTN